MAQENAHKRLVRLPLLVTEHKWRVGQRALIVRVASFCWRELLKDIAVAVKVNK